MKNKKHRMKRFFSRLSYSFGNEDWRTEREALRIEKGNKVLCISASGDRSLHLLLDDCAHLVSIDANPTQNYLLNLKCAALHSLDYDEYIGFLGGIPNSHRLASYRKIASHLNEEAATFWMKHRSMIHKGVLYQGFLERFTKLVSKAFFLLRPFKVKKIFLMTDIEEQRKYLKKWDTFLFRKTFDVILSQKICNLLSIDPGLYAHTDSKIGLGEYIYQRMMKALNHTLAKDNLLFSLIFRGYIEPSAFPPYLSPQGYAIIRQRLKRLSIQTQDINTHLEEQACNSYDRFSMSDVASYLSEECFHRLLNNIHRTARPGARFCIRQFSSNHKLPDDFDCRFKREHALEKQLESEDQCFVYRFLIGEVIKSRADS